MSQIIEGASGEVVNAKNSVAFAQQTIDDVGTKKSGGTGHNYAHSLKFMLQNSEMEMRVAASQSTKRRHALPWRHLPGNSLYHRLFWTSFLRLVARRPAHTHISEAMIHHMLWLIKISAVNHDRKTDGTIEPRQVDLGKLLPVGQNHHRVSILRSFVEISRIAESVS